MYGKLIYLILFILVSGLVGAAGGAEGLHGEYFHGSSDDPWQTLVLERLDPTVDFNWAGGSPEPGIVNTDNFTVRWTGDIEVPTTETYTFHTQTDDGVRLWVNNELIIDNWTDHSNTHDSGTIDLRTGQKYNIRLEYYEGGADAVCELSWSTPTITREAIPSQYLWVERPFPRNPDPENGSILRDTWITMSWTPGDYAASHDVYFGENYNDVKAGTGDTLIGNQTETRFAVGFTGFPYPEGLVSGKTYYWRIVDVEADGTTKHEGEIWSFMIAPRTAYNANPALGAESIDPNYIELTWEPGFGGLLHHVYFGDNFSDVKAGAMNVYKGPRPNNKYVPGTLELEKAYYWRVDEFDGTARYEGDVWSFTTPGAVGSPKPPTGAVDVKHTKILKWNAGDNTASYQIYFGTDPDAVANATTGSPEYQGTRNLGSEGYDPGMLEWDTTYYWRIDEVNNVHPESPWKGSIWSFRTADFFIIDNFEDYNDYEPDRIFDAWIDGYGIATNGSTIGYAEPDFLAGEHFVETINVHSGSQAMPYFYDNSAAPNSEAVLTLVYPTDWTERDVITLTLWFRGNSANAAGPIYVVLDGSAVVYHDNPDAISITWWTEWNIDLQEFVDQGADLTNVNSIGIGFGNRSNAQLGGSGLVFFDDIRLYPPQTP